MNQDSVLDYPLPGFRFEVKFFLATEGADNAGEDRLLCSGAFSECTGLEASMEPRVIKAGGHNYGDFQRAGRVTFATVILKRGVTKCRDIWEWFKLVNTGSYAYRLNAEITVYDYGEGRLTNPVMTWRMEKALPIKFKVPDFNASATQVPIEELHFVHEGLSHELEQSGDET